MTFAPSRGTKISLSSETVCFMFFCLKGVAALEIRLTQRSVPQTPPQSSLFYISALVFSPFDWPNSRHLVVFAWCDKKFTSSFVWGGQIVDLTPRYTATHHATNSLSLSLRVWCWCFRGAALSPAWARVTGWKCAFNGTRPASFGTQPFPISLWHMPHVFADAAHRVLNEAAVKPAADTETEKQLSPPK